MSRCFRWTTSSLVLALFLCLVPGRPAQAQQMDAFQQHLDQGVALFKDKHYREAIDEFEAAYVLNPVPKLLFDLGQAHLKLQHCTEAQSYYDRYERAETQISPEDRELLKESREKARALCQAPAQAPVLVPKPQPQVVAAAPPPAAPPRPARTPLYKRWWLWTAVGVVAAGAVAGAVAGVYARGPDYPNVIQPVYSK